MSFWTRILLSREALLLYCLIFLIIQLPKVLPFLIVACIFALVAKAGGGDHDF